MKKTNSGLSNVTAVVSIAIAVLAGSVYVFASFGNSTGKIEARLKDAKKTVAEETEKLNNMKSSLASGNSLRSAVNHQLARARNALSRTDILFENADSTNAKFRINAGSAMVSRINSGRSNISAILASWKVRLASSEAITEATLTALREDIATIESFINELNTIVGNLSADGSGLSASQIQSYTLATLGALEEINAVSTAVNSGGVLAGLATNTVFPDVTVINIEAQEVVVAQAQQTVTNVEQELTQATTPTTPTVEIQPAPTYDDTDQSQYLGDYNNPTVKYIVPYDPTPIYIQPGPPSLIQWMNKN